MQVDMIIDVVPKFTIVDGIGRPRGEKICILLIASKRVVSLLNAAKILPSHNQVERKLPPGWWLGKEVAKSSLLV